MVITKDVDLPTEEDLTVQEINIGTPALYAGAMYVGKQCQWKNNEFMLCKKELKDPRMCLNEGKEVTSCALDVFRTIKANCADEFVQYSDCISKSSSNYMVKHCRNTQAVFDQCMAAKTGITRPKDHGYFTRGQIHDSPRPKPEKQITVYADAAKKFPSDFPTPPARYGLRHHFYE